MRTLLFHAHGLAGIDFSAMHPDQLAAVEAAAASADLGVVPTIYLRRDRLSELEKLLHYYTHLASLGRVPSILGFAVEGPLLGPQGGIPRAGKWLPTPQEWMRLAELGMHGLKYVVIAPDAMELTGEIGSNFSFSTLITTFYDNGVRLALGHFHRQSPDESAIRTRKFIEYLHSQYDSSPHLILTDHLYNDMPRNFRHAWRTASERERRAAELSPVLTDWSQADLSVLLGPVPATLLDAAMAGQLMPCIHFDGEHVDMAIVAKTVAWLGPFRLIAMTDHTEVLTMAGEALTKDPESGLLLRDDGVVAAGSSGPESQRANMRAIGMSEQDIQAVFLDNPLATIAFQPGRRTP